MNQSERDLLPYLKIKLNLNHVDYDDVWQEGFESGSKNVTEACNPYHHDSKEFEYWRDGWWAAFYGEETLFETENEPMLLTPENLPSLVTKEAANDPIDIPRIRRHKRPQVVGKKAKLYDIAFKVMYVVFATGVIFNIYEMAA